MNVNQPPRGDVVRSIRRVRDALSFVVTLGCLTACGTPDDVVEVYPTQGKVTFKGAPVVDALIVFKPVKPLKTESNQDVPNPTARTDADGAFILGTYSPGDGAPAGEFLVSISSVPEAGVDKPGFLAPKNKKELAKKKTDLLRGKYNNVERSGLKASVAPSLDNPPLQFELK